MIVASQRSPAPISSSSDSSEVAETASARRAGVGAPESPMRVRARPVAMAQTTRVIAAPMMPEAMAIG